MQKMSFLFDTGSPWTWVPSIICPSNECSGEHYNYKKSSGYRTTNNYDEVKYGIGKVMGYVVNDDIAITSDPKTMATDVNFISVYSAEELDTLESDGLLGLSPKTYRRGESGEEIHLLVNELKKDGVIDRAMFAMYLADDRRKSVAHFGGYDPKIVEESLREMKDRGIDTSGSEGGIYWTAINSDVHWRVRLLDASVGDRSWRPSVSDLIFDTGTSLNYMPEADYMIFTDEVKKNTNCNYLSQDDLVYCDCDSEEDKRFPTLAFRVGRSGKQHRFYLQGRDYLMYNRGYKRCALLVKKELSLQQSMWLMGQPFLRAYYSIYDMDAKEIGLVGVATTTRDTY
jgi:hypothetical protein